MTNQLRFFAQKILTAVSVNLNKPLNQPTSIIFNISQSCMLKCKQCDIWKTKPHPPITYDQAKIIIDKIYDWLGVFQLLITGGEPFMNPFLPQIIEYCHQKGIYTIINSNGYLINNVLAQKIVSSHLNAITISIDGSNPITHDNIRGVKGSYRRAVNAIRLLNKYKYKSKSSYPKIYINTIVMKENINELVDIAHISQIENTQEIIYQCLMPNFGTYHKQDYNKIASWPSNNKKLFRIFYKISKLKKRDWKYSFSSGNLQSVYNYYSNPLSVDSLTCRAGINNFIFDSQGDVRLCFQFAPIGNLFVKNLSAKEIWFSILSQQQRKVIRNCRQPCKICACNRIDYARMAFQLLHP